MRLAILRIHKDEQGYHRHHASRAQLDLSGVEAVYEWSMEGMIVHKARNEVVEQALQDPGWDTAFMMDDDMVFPPGAVQRAATMMAQRGIGIYSGLYFERRFPHTPQAYEEAQEDEFRGKYWAIVDYRERADAEGMLKVAGCGAGFLFVRRAVFEAVKRPWFVFLDRMGEDFYFCRKARMKGYETWCDVNNQATHIGIMDVHEGVYQQIRPMLRRAIPGPGEQGPSMQRYEVGAPA